MFLRRYCYFKLFFSLLADLRAASNILHRSLEDEGGGSGVTGVAHHSCFKISSGVGRFSGSKFNIRVNKSKSAGPSEYLSVSKRFLSSGA